MKNISTSMNGLIKAFKNGKSLGWIQDLSFLVNFAHVKGPSQLRIWRGVQKSGVGLPGAKSRSAMHDAMHYDQYWFPENCPDKSLLPQIIAACPFEPLWRIKNIPQSSPAHGTMQPVWALSQGRTAGQFEDRA